MKSKTYTEKFEELTKIIKELEGTDITIDDMTSKINQAIILLDQCKESLHEINEDVNKIIEEIYLANDNEE
ncbi:MAG: exodeoxyribonuclease VII small subunit [Bacteroidales bacterium]|nr:exodeoxyribonuclease VII small subunit [Bacteroidales bacterium]